MESACRWLTSSVMTGVKPFGGSKAEFIIPFLSEFPYERFFKEHIGSCPCFTTQNLGTFANFPSVKVDGGHVAHFFQSHRIEVA